MFQARLKARIASSLSLAALAVLVATSSGCASDPERDPFDSTGSDAGDVDTGDSGKPANPTKDGGADSGKDSGTDAGKDSGTDAGPECTDTSDCPAPSSTCVDATCKSGVCGETPKASGTSVDGDTVGDCKKLQCDGAGKVVSANDDTDVPDDKNPCTDDICTNGTASHTFKGAGTTCGTALVCDAAGHCQGCNQASDCDGIDDECSKRTCNDGTCGRSYTEYGAPVTAQTAGDCKTSVCDGAGKTIPVNDDTDTASDNNSCTNDVCKNGTLSHPSVGDGTLCDGGKTCKAGVCTGCTTATDCPTNHTECQFASCNDGICGLNNAPKGTRLTAQTNGDCKTAVCGDDGNVTWEADNADLPNDNKVCTDDICTNGVASNPPVPFGTVCTENGGEFCDGKDACVAASCTDGAKNGDETDVDCGGATCPACGQVSVTPADAATNVAVNATITLTFNSAMDGTTITAQSAAGACTGSVQVSADDFATCLAFSAPGIDATNKIVTLTATANFANNTTYKVRVTNAAKTSGGVAAAPYTMATGFKTVQGAASCSGAAVIISQVYGGNGNGGALYKKDFVELHNRTAAPVVLDGWSIQYASKAGDFQATQVVKLSGTIAAWGYFLVQQGGDGTTGSSLPTPDSSGNQDMSGTAGKVALVKSQTNLAGSCAGATVVDLVSYGSGTNCSETAAAPAPSGTLAVFRKDGGCTDTNDNSKDFEALAPAPRNSASPVKACTCN